MSVLPDSGALVTGEGKAYHRDLDRSKDSLEIKKNASATDKAALANLLLDLRR